VFSTLFSSADADCFEQAKAQIVEAIAAAAYIFTFLQRTSPSCPKP